MQLRRLAALERQELQVPLRRADARHRRVPGRSSPATSGSGGIVGEELAEIVAKFGDERRTQIVADEGDVTDEDLIAERDIVVTLTRGGYAKATDVGLYRAQRRGGRGVRGAQLRGDDVVSHFFVTTTHHWILFFTTKGRVYRAKGYELPDAGRDARGQHVANLLAFQPDEHVAQVLDLREFASAEYLVLATRDGMVKKTRLREFDSIRSNGLAAINLRDGDELISAQLVRRRGRADAGLGQGRLRAVPRRRLDAAPDGPGHVRGAGDPAASRGHRAVDGGCPSWTSHLVTVTDGGFAKRTAVSEWRTQGRNTFGVTAMKLVEQRGSLVGGPDLRGVRRAVTRSRATAW